MQSCGLSFSPHTLSELLQLVVSSHNVNESKNWAREALGEPSFWNVNPFLFLGQPFAERFGTVVCSYILDGENVCNCNWNSIFSHCQCTKLRCSAVLKCTSPQTLCSFWVFALMWCLSLKFGNTSRGWTVISSSENIGATGTDSSLG